MLHAHDRLTNCSLKMYKDRIKKWRLDKKNKESEMLAILRKNAERAAVRKSSLFQVRGQPVDMEQVHHYFKRKNAIRDPEAYNAPTPSDVSCRTPSPGPKPSSLEHRPQIATARDFSFSDQIAQVEQTELARTANTDDCVGVNGMMLHLARSISDEERIIRWTLNDMYRLISDEGEIPRSPSAPPTLLIPERLFFTVRTYMDSSFERGFWIIDEEGDCTVLGMISDDEYNAPVDFCDYGRTALDFLDKGLLIEFRRTLAKAFRLLKTLIRIEHPRALELNNQHDTKF